MEEVIDIIHNERPIVEFLEAMQYINPYDSWQGQTLYSILRGRMTRLQRIGNYEQSILLKQYLFIVIRARRKLAARHAQKRFLRKYVRHMRRERRIRESIWGKKVFKDRTGRDDSLGPAKHIQGLLHPGARYVQWCTI